MKLQSATLSLALALALASFSTASFTVAVNLNLAQRVDDSVYRRPVRLSATIKIRGNASSRLPSARSGYEASIFAS